MNISAITKAHNLNTGDVIVLHIPDTIYQIRVEVADCYMGIIDGKVIYSEYPLGQELLCQVLEPFMKSDKLVFRPVYLVRFWEDDEFIDFMIGMKKELQEEVSGKW